MRPAFAQLLFSNWERTTTGRATEIYTNIYSLIERERMIKKKEGKRTNLQWRKRERT